NIDQRANSGLLHVCQDVEPDDAGYIVCNDQPGGDTEAPYTGTECSNPTPLPPGCVIDFIPKVRIKGRLLLVNDDQAFDSFANSREASSIILEIKAGKKKATLIEIFDNTAIGNWNQFQEFFFGTALPIEFSNVDSTAFQFANGNLFEIGLRLRVLAQEWFPKADLSQAV